MQSIVHNETPAVRDPQLLHLQADEEWASLVEMRWHGDCTVPGKQLCLCLFVFLFLFFFFVLDLVRVRVLVLVRVLVRVHPDKVSIGSWA